MPQNSMKIKLTQTYDLRRCMNLLETWNTNSNVKVPLDMNRPPTYLVHTISSAKHF
jgi:hypothetical protein